MTINCYKLSHLTLWHIQYTLMIWWYQHSFSNQLFQLFHFFLLDKSKIDGFVCLNPMSSWRYELWTPFYYIYVINWKIFFDNCTLQCAPYLYTMYIANHEHRYIRNIPAWFLPQFGKPRSKLYIIGLQLLECCWRKWNFKALILYT
jgi:hypothetical protein